MLFRSGEFIAKDAVIDGRISSEEGFIGGFEINKLSISSNDQGRSLELFSNGRIVAKNAEIKGHIEATSGSFKGKLATPFSFIPKYTTTGQILDIEKSFNLSVSSEGLKTVFLPTDTKYNGVMCNIYNRGMTTNEGAISIKIQGNLNFTGRKTTETVNTITIQKGQIATFIGILAEEEELRWACINYSDLQ